MSVLILLYTGWNFAFARRHNFWGIHDDDGDDARTLVELLVSNELSIIRCVCNNDFFSWLLVLLRKINVSIFFLLFQALILNYDVKFT